MAIIKMNTPRYKRNHGLYPEQKEYGLRGAVFPQLILGVHDQLSNRFVVNPHLLNMYDSSIMKIPQRGIWIDQTSFNLIIRQTGYLRFAELDSEGSYHGRGLDLV
jgi:hypothetical protein